MAGVALTQDAELTRSVLLIVFKDLHSTTGIQSGSIGKLRGAASLKGWETGIKSGRAVMTGLTGSVIGPAAQGQFTRYALWWGKNECHIAVRQIVVSSH